MLKEKGRIGQNWEIKYLFPLLLFSIPFSISFDFGWHRIDLPSEPLIVVLAICLLYRIGLVSLFQSKFFRHPITLIACGYLLWTAMTVPFSSNWIVSLKYLLVRGAHFWVFYIGFWYYSQSAKGGVFRWLGYYSIAFMLIMFYAWTVHARYDFRPDASVLSARPFYWDHALYSAALSLLLFPMALRGFWPPSDLHRSAIERFYPIFASVVFLLGIYLSYSRAAWISLFVCLLILVAIHVLKYRLFVILCSITSLIGLIVGTLFLIQAYADKGDGREPSNYEISDVSNLERLNRYRCAWRMFVDRPITGFGPGTFAREFAIYQRPEEMTRISVPTSNARSEMVHPPGRGGGAHSEYFQALSEMGFPGFLLWLALVSYTFYTGIKRYYRKAPKHQRHYVLSITLGLTTFFVHGLFNNFLHSDKVAVLFWVLLAALVKTQGEDQNGQNSVAES
jgi:O-antigen ligase